MPKFQVSYTLIKKFPEGSDVRTVELDVNDLSVVSGVITHPELAFFQIVKNTEPEKAPRKKKEKKDA